MSERLPTVFISHGGGPWPFMAIEPPGAYDGLAAWLRAMPDAVGAKPKAVLVVSAHWEEDEPTVMTNPRPSLLYDYYGFPPETYRLRYDAPGSPALAERVRTLLRDSRIACRDDDARGYDHGVFVPMMLAYPKADVPIVQLSIQRDLDPAAHLEIGRAIAPLRDEGVLIAGSGMTYHNLRAFGEAGREPSAQFDAWLTDAVTAAAGAGRSARLERWSTAPAARAAHPREDHLIPLMVVVGAAENEGARATFSGTVRAIKLSCYQLG
jgi:aromatic ring-opening dioxygenase catalytic subunit (LigB family)